MERPLRPLEDLIVIDLSRYLPGPLLTRMLCDLGATVIKVEPPNGDAMRYTPPQHRGMSLSYGGLNAGKQSIVVNLKAPEGVALLRAMIAKADVLVESFRPGVLARLGLAPEDLRTAYPRLIIASLTGFGQTGPLADRAGHDLTYLARAGLLSLQGPKDGPPTVPLAQISDVGGGTYPATVGILAALLDRNLTGEGRWLDVSLTRSAAAFNPVLLTPKFVGKGAKRGEDMLTGAAPCYRCYETQDGRHMAVGALEPWFWKKLCEVAQRPDLIALQYDASEAAHQTVEDLFRTRAMADWTALFDGHDVACEPVLTPAEALADEALGLAVVFTDGFPVMPVPMGAPTPSTFTPPSALGADADAVFASLELSEETVTAARSAGALK
ncbi:MAG: CoA transferase [Rhodobacterales bacterium]|nr:CoA transferase [Rhodobacterales bacterium]